MQYIAHIKYIITIGLVSSIWLITLNNLYSQRTFEEFKNPRKSITIFKKNISKRDSLNDIQIPYYDHLYYLKNLPCYKYIFRPNNTVEYESSCPVCYTIGGEIGKFSIKDNSIEVISDSLVIYHKFVDQISKKENIHQNLEFKIFDKDRSPIGKILTIYYTKTPTFLNKKKSISTRHDDISSLVGKSIFLNSITIEVYLGANRKVLSIPINEKIKFENYTYNIYLKNKGFIIKMIENRIFLYYWDHIKQRYEKKDELIYKLG